MKTTIYWLVTILLTLGLLALGIALAPKGQARVGLQYGQLTPCPETPNCVCSEYRPASSYIAPLTFTDSAEHAWQRLQAVIVASGGVIQTQQQGYLWARFTTKWLRFMDDVEFRMDADNHLIQVRSASRQGRSDFGVNRKRVEMLRSLFNNKPAE